MKNLKKKISLAILSITFIFLISIFFFFKSLASPGMTCQLTFGSCSSGICLFSMNRTTNSHAGDCNYDKWKVCCSDPVNTLRSTIKTTACDPNLNEAGVLSLNSLSNSHAWNYSDTDGLYHICLNSSSSEKFACKTMTGSCNVGSCVASLNQVADTHVGNCSEYQNSICCGYSCEGSISVSNDDITCGKSNFTITVRNTGFETLLVDINDTLWEDTNGDGNPDVLADYKQVLNVQMLSGNVTNITWKTNQAADPFIGYIHRVYFCSKPFNAICGKSTSSCLTEAIAGNMDIVTDFSFNCISGPGVCNNAVVDLGEECDMGPPVRWGACAPYEKCNITTCQCYDFRPIDCIGCSYYDWCENGYEPGNPLKSCCEDSSGNEIECCVDQNNPLIRYQDCSVPNAIRDLNANVTNDYCYNQNCDMTGKCVDSSWVEHEIFQTC